MRNIIFILSTLIVLASCKEDDSIIGLDLQNNQFSVQYDTIHTTTTSTLLADSLSLNGASIGLLGDYIDPDFGRVQPVLAFQVVPKTTVVNLGDNPIGDSIVITLQERSGYYGLDSAATQKVKVYRIHESKNLDDLDSTVVNFSTLEQYKGPQLADTTMVFNPNDSIGFSIKVNKVNLADEFLANATSFASDSTFKRFFGGVIIETENRDTHGNIISIDFNVTQTNIRLHYHNAAEDTVKKVFDFLLKDINSQRYSIFKHTYAGSPIETALVQDALYQEKSFIQGMNGVGMKIRIDNLDSLAAENAWAINSANLTLKLVPEDDSIMKYAPPSSILIKMLNDEGNEVFTPDYETAGGATSAPENYNPDIHGYKIRINRLLRKALLENKQSITLTIYTTSPLTKPNRGIVAGSTYSKPELRPVLHVIRSK
ncbi:MAG: DUF4270 family protein [Salinivirgaceae bacterium]|nr:DUF4270 family protein [Salinivirgaceae bacterium]